MEEESLIENSLLVLPVDFDNIWFVHNLQLVSVISFERARVDVICNIRYFVHCVGILQNYMDFFDRSTCVHNFLFCQTLLGERSTDKVKMMYQLAPVFNNLQQCKSNTTNHFIEQFAEEQNLFFQKLFL